MSPNGYLLYHGPSLLTGAPIVVILTLFSRNRKTGNMLQTYILPADLDPVAASQQGLDDATCGQCSARHSLGGHCYVNLGQAPRAIWRSWQAGRYPPITRRTYRKLAGRALRLGAYGDPAAVPFEVWQPLIAVAGTITGYTHQYDHPNFDPRLLDTCMVSTEDPATTQALRDRGVRTFRTKTADQPLLDGEILCPFDDANDIQCIDCGICRGAQATTSVAIDVHGFVARRYELIAKEAA